ncbi:MAG: monooxygenase [Deltaproteobacteria bacterium]|nr:monooxygenase [Deltaproteobacteria bacterium]
MNTCKTPLDVIVVGAGAAGVGVSIALMDAGIENLLVLERNTVGASFAMWPKETRFITPSFPTNSAGMLDLNSIAIGISPAYNMRVEHPTGQQYAEHLQNIASFFKIPIREHTTVVDIKPENGVFLIETTNDKIWTKHVVWAVGEYQYPRLFSFIGSSICRHTATIESYAELNGDDFVIIGGYESGLDAAYHLARRNKKVKLIDRACPWGDKSSDPSVSLSTYSFERMKDPQFISNVELIPDIKVTKVKQSDKGYQVHTEDGRCFHTPTTPLLGVGFTGGHGLVADLFALRNDGFPLLTKDDESTKVSGIFLCGPHVRHGNLIFCFIYKYRQRFAVVAKAISTSLGLPADKLESYRQWGMYLDDLTICGQDCVC